MIRLTDVSKTFWPSRRRPPVHALVDVSLHFAAGETTVLVGPSGSGKSTVLRLINGLVSPDTGDVTFDGRPLQPESIVDVRRRVGYVIQDGGLFPHLTARANVTLAARTLHSGALDIERRVSDLADLVQLPERRLSDYPSQLSGGQRQRVSLMRALMLDPDVLLLDEPLGALDPMIRASLQEHLKSLFQLLRKTVVIVTHDLAEAALLGHRIVLLNEGSIVQSGTIGDLVDRPANDFVAQFVSAHRSAVLSTSTRGS